MTWADVMRYGEAEVGRVMFQMFYEFYNNSLSREVKRKTL